MSDREVTEFDLRAEEFKRRDVKPEDYEFRDDGKIVRKDRWENGIRTIAANAPGIGSRSSFEIPDVVAAAKRAFNAQQVLDDLHQKLYERVGLTEGAVLTDYQRAERGIYTMLSELAAEHGYTLGGDNDKDA